MAKKASSATFTPASDPDSPSSGSGEGQVELDRGLGRVRKKILTTRATAAELISKGAAPSLLAKVGYVGTHSIGMAGGVVALLYLVFLVPEPPMAKPDLPPSSKPPPPLFQRPLPQILKALVVAPLARTFRTLVRPRPGRLRPLLLLLLLTFFVLLMPVSSGNLEYLYMLRVFDGFTGADYAYFELVSKALSLFGLVVVVPVVCGRLGVHETLVLPVLSALSVVSFAARAWVRDLWPGFYIADGINLMGLTLYGLTRTLVTRCVELHEVGKVFSAFGVTAGFIPLVMIPVFRGLYQSTLDTFPGAYLLAVAGIYTVATVLFLALLTQRRHLGTSEREKKKLEREEEERKRRDADLARFEAET